MSEKSSENLTYESAVLRLEEIVAMLEKNEVTLDESMALFEEGTKLTAFCSKKLKDAEQKITKLTKKQP
ncbi:MAG: exodeoxyribonuclease VII small subunit [Clostridiales bacterium]|nr:exodeoxyribonuclease VII small subunit [Clostridiales bacterium]